MTRHAGGGGRARGNTETEPSPADVRVDAGLGDPEVRGDLFGGKSAGHGAQHLPLPSCEGDKRVRALGQDAARNEIPGDEPDERGGRALHPDGERPRLAG